MKEGEVRLELANEVGPLSLSLSLGRRSKEVGQGQVRMAAGRVQTGEVSAGVGRKSAWEGNDRSEVLTREHGLLTAAPFAVYVTVATAGFAPENRDGLAGNDLNDFFLGKVPLLSIEAIHQLHIFIFVLATTHVILSVLTMLLGSAKIRQWKHWEVSIHKETVENASAPAITHVHQTEFVRSRFLGIGKDSVILSWLHSFFKQIFGSVTKSDYSTMRLGFIMAHCKGNRKFDFHKYMVRALEADFKKVVGISWYLWIFVVIFLLLNVGGWHVYFWLSFIPLILLFTVGTKLEHIITQLAHDVAEKNTAIEGDLVVKPSDDHFWCHRPRIVLFLIHLILFQNAFEIAYFFFILTIYGYHSCIMDSSEYIIPRVSISAVVQIICSYSTLPLYAIVTQMGSSFKPAIFEEHVQEGLVEWAQKAKMKGRRATSTVSTRPKEEGIQLQKVFTQTDPLMQESRVEIVEVDSGSNMQDSKITTNLSSSKS
ncbi:hypothetical protein IEQ34_006757 [Dendrobium chrysotoxum]|uniref:MLO-like protein n=1 Tax=Dendrobium chrysotoxum TaxID=161865 RepID=A0AAV7H632_DENCH|nr:hypothetical protein IEQ34_006757 [Dendrobium chrysotoxum]